MNETAFVLIGIGGAGGKIVNAVAEANASGMRTVAVDTDFAAVARLGSCQQIRIGNTRFGGLGSGGDRNGAAMAFDETRASDTIFSDAQIAIVVAGISRGTGAGVLPKILENAAKRNVRTIVFMIAPFAFEGVELARRAAEIEQTVAGLGDVRIVCSNENLCPIAENDTLELAFDTATQTLARGITLIWKMTSLPGYINLDFATLGTIIVNGRGMCNLGVGSSTGPSRVKEATEALLGTTGVGLASKLNGARAALVGIIGGDDLRLKEVADVMARIGAALSMEAPIRMGTVLDPSIGSALHIVVLLFREWHSLDEAQTDEDEPDAAESAGQRRGILYNAPPRQNTTKKTNRSRTKALSGRFQDSSATWVNGENLDRPTFLRRKLYIDVS